MFDADSLGRRERLVEAQHLRAMDGGGIAVIYGQCG